MTLSILAPTRYPWTFNGPRRSRHMVERRRFVPLNYLSSWLEGVTVLNPVPPRRFDLVHGFNRIPIGARPFVIGFESHLPRVINRERSRVFAAQAAMLASDRCRAVVPISRSAELWFRDVHGGGPHWRALERKLRLRYPNLPIPPEPDAVSWEGRGPIRLVFVGAHFARKGGCVAVTMAEEALRRGVDLEVTIVSALEMGGGIWTDPLRDAFFDPYRALLDLPNVAHRPGLPNADVLALLRTAHFCVLPTFGDTFGYSAAEAMTVHTPVLATRQGALPEFIEDGESGILLDLETTRYGAWTGSDRADRSSAAFEALFRAEVARLAEDGLARVLDVMGDPPRYARMRAAARRGAEARFSSDEASRYWDDLYETVLG